MKRCCKCKEEFSEDRFYKNKKTTDGLYSWCKSCSSEATRAYLKNNPDYQRKRYKTGNGRNSLLKYKFGITTEIFDNLLLAQDNRCKICNSIFESTKDRHIDHCHTTLKVRGILCSKCNLGLGLFNDDPDRLQRAIYYLTGRNHE